MSELSLKTKVSCEISALLIWIHVANSAGGGTDPPRGLNSSACLRGRRSCQGLTMGSSQLRWFPLITGPSVWSLLRVSDVSHHSPVHHWGGEGKSQEVEKMLKRYWIPFTGCQLSWVFCFGCKMQTSPIQALAVYCQWIPTSPWTLELSPNQSKWGKWHLLMEDVSLWQLASIFVAHDIIVVKFYINFEKKKC